MRQARHLPLHRSQEVGRERVVPPCQGLGTEEALVDEGVEDLDLRVDAGESGLGGAEGAGFVCLFVCFVVVVVVVYLVWWLVDSFRWLAGGKVQ
jgi:hypothetical protein